jgi:3-dehydroquinate synthase II
VGDWEARKNRITAGLESGVDWVLVDATDVERVRELGDVDVAAFVDGDRPEGAAAPDLAVVGKNGEGDGTMDLPPDLSGSADLTAEDWTIIPLENLIARVDEETDLVAGVESAEAARTAFETLEVGVDGVLLDSSDPDEIRRTVELRDAAATEHLDLRWGEVVDVERVGSADRVCVDTGSLMNGDEGMLVGSMSRGLLFVHAETADSPYVASRPFRVNAGAVHAYVRVPGDETKYLAELESGDEVLVVDTDGNTRTAVVGRAKIETRPMFRVEVAVENDTVESLVQNAETIKLETEDGPVAVTDLEAGDEVKLFYEATARHFGTAVEERIIEK